MRFLFVHQNFPGQYRHLAAHYAREGHQVVALGEKANRVFDDVDVLLTPTIASRPRRTGVLNKGGTLTQGTNEMILKTPTHVLMDFYPLFVTLDVTKGLKVIGNAKTVVMGGTADLVTPIKHSRRLAEAIPGAKLVALEDVGHMVPFEEHAKVTKVIEDVLEEIA